MSPTATLRAADGKTLRAAWAEGRQLHGLHLFVQRAAITLDQVAVAERSGEVDATRAWIEQIAQQVPGLAVLTGDALLAQRDLCSAIIASKRTMCCGFKKPTEPVC